MVDPVAWYDANSETVVGQYEEADSDDVHGWLRDLLPKASATVLDVGAGSGRDAAWLAAKGHDVVAVEPSASMRKAGASRHADPSINWINDRLPALDAVSRTGQSFDLILLSAVWMHLPQRDRPRALRKMINLLKPGGLLAATLRCGPADRKRGIHAVSLEEIETLARNYGAFVERHAEGKDHLGRSDIRWIQVALRLPDDSTGALPLFRHIILNDDKSSTYKLALLRTLCRVADGAAGFALAHDSDDSVAVPLGLIALTWLRLFKPLLKAGLPQSPSNRGLQRLGFVGDAYRKLAGVSHRDLRVGMKFSGELSAVLHQALKDAGNTIERMPAAHMTYPNGGEIFPVRKSGRTLRPSSFQLDRSYLSSFGEMLIPGHLWRALQRYGVWMEPAVVAEWSRLIKSYALRQGVEAGDAAIAAAMVWDEPIRDVRLARERALEILANGQLFCVWSGKKLAERSLDIDHCLPWTVWPCGDLWNLMPAHRTINQHEKGACLPAGRLLRSAQDRVVNWWGEAYSDGRPVVSEQFWTQARSSLPSVNAADNTLNDIFDALCLQRMRLKHDQQAPEWTGKR